MSLPSTFLLEFAPARLPLGALWHVSKSTVIGWTSSANPSRAAPESLQPPEFSTVAQATQRHAFFCHLQPLLELPRLAARATSTILRGVAQTQAAVAAPPYQCQANVHAIRPWQNFPLTTHATFAASGPWRLAMPANLSVQAKRLQYPTGAGSGNASDGGRGAGGSGSSSKGDLRAKPERTREMQVRPRISEHDLTYRIRRMEGWLEDGIR